jgi:uncharacterized membrane protein YhiD involved in acid resistance
MLDFLTLQTATTHPTVITTLYTVVLAFILSSLIALTYERTFRGLSYSRHFVQAIILIAIVAAMVMQAIGENPVRGLGILGALAIIRFRTVFKDPRDIIFMFASAASGISCGVFGYGIAVIGTLCFCGAAIALYYSPFGQSRYFDGMLRFNIVSDSENRPAIETLLRQYCKNFALITLREMAQGERLDFAYHVKLKNTMIKEEFIDKLRKINSIKDVNLMLQETTVEL